MDLWASEIIHVCLGSIGHSVYMKIRLFRVLDEMESTDQWIWIRSMDQLIQFMNTLIYGSIEIATTTDVSKINMPSRHHIF